MQQPDQPKRTLSEDEAWEIKRALLAAAAQGCPGRNGGTDPELLVRGLISAFELLESATAASANRAGNPPAGAEAA